MTDEQIHFYAIARMAVPIEARVSTHAEPAAGGIIYTIVLEAADRSKRWFAIHSNVLREGFSDELLIWEIRRAVENKRAVSRQSATRPRSTRGG